MIAVPLSDPTGSVRAARVAAPASPSLTMRLRSESGALAGAASDPSAEQGAFSSEGQLSGAGPKDGNRGSLIRKDWRIPPKKTMSKKPVKGVKATVADPTPESGSQRAVTAPFERPLPSRRKRLG